MYIATMAGRSRLERLPDNILDAVFRHVDSPAITSLVQTSRRVRATAAPIYDLKRRVLDLKLQAVLTDRVLISGDGMLALMYIRPARAEYTYTLRTDVGRADLDRPEPHFNGILANIRVTADGIHVDCSNCRLIPPQVDAPSPGPHIYRQDCENISKFVNDYINDALPRHPVLPHRRIYDPFPFLIVE